MGKARPRRGGRSHRSNPTGQLVAADGSAEGDPSAAAGDARAHSIVMLANQLKSASAEERLCGCLTLSQLASEQLAVRVLRDQRLVRLAGPLLVDSCPDTRQAAAGALRNLSVTGGREGCEEMLSQDVLTPLLVAIGKYRDDWEPQRRVEKGTVLLDAQSETLVQMTHLLWNLCEASERAVEALNRSDAGRVLLRCLDPARLPAELTQAAGQCLLAVSEENTSLAQLARDHLPLLHRLATADDASTPAAPAGDSSTPAGDSSTPAADASTPAAPADALLMRVLALGILLNVADSAGSDVQSAAVLSPAQAVSVICSALRPDVLSRADQLGADAAADTDANAAADTDANAAADADHCELKVSELERLVTAQQLALELLAERVHGDDASDGSDGGWQDVSDDEWSAEDDPSAGAEPMEADGAAPAQAALPAELRAALQDGLWARLLSMAAGGGGGAATEQVLQGSGAGRQLSRRLRTLQARALLCLSSLVSALQPAELQQLWTQLSQLLLTEQPVCDEQLQEAAAGLLRALLQRLLDAGLDGPQLGAAQMRLLQQQAAACQLAATRATLLRCVALLGCLRVRGAGQLSGDDALLVQQVGTWLLERAAADRQLAVTAEALDALMDVFAEDSTDAVGAAVQLVPRLRQLQPALRHQMQQQRGQLGDLYPLVATVRTNLPRFIKYKASRPAAGAAQPQNGH